MILHYGSGDSTYDEDTSEDHWGKYDSPIAKYIADRMQADGDFGDEDWSNPDIGEGFARYGRRIQYWDSQGFVSCDTFATIAEAEAHFARCIDEMSSDCETCGASVGPYDWEDHDCEDYNNGPLVGRYVKVRGYEGVAFVVRDHYESGRIVATMVGDDTRHVVDEADLSPLSDEDFCHGCGQIGCNWH